MSNVAVANDSIRSVATTVTLTNHEHHQPKITIPITPHDPPHDPPPVQPSIFKLFHTLPPRQSLLLLTPAIIVSLVAGGIAPFMTYVVGNAFNVFSRYSQIDHPTSQDRQHLRHGISIAALELLALAAGALLLGLLTSSLWIWTGEYNVRSLRRRVYRSVTKKDMIWFDLKVGNESNSPHDDDDDDAEETHPVGPGGMMSRFTKETDHVQQASSLATGLAIQHLTTCITCLGLAFTRSWLLTLVILSAVPALVVVQGLSQGLSSPLLEREIATNAQAATVVERVVSAIATVKAFNAAAFEYASLERVLRRLYSVDRRLNAVWGFTSAMSQFVLMAMFVQGFWFGAKLVREGRLSAGDVMAVFWACLIATSNLQMCIPQFLVLTKGKLAMASLLTLAQSPPVSGHQPLKTKKFYRSDGVKSFRKIIPQRSLGEMGLQNVTFAYAARSTVPVLKDTTLFLPAKEMTFIVGGSGSGKSTIAHLLLRIYRPQSGVVQLDNQDAAYLDEMWLRQEVACVSQDCILFDMSVHENVAMGLTGFRSPADATRAEVIEACRAALMHDFVRELPDGYDTKLGTGGALLSGGQRQRLAIARALLRNPTVLILDESTSALDATSRLLVFEAIKRWRKKMTTVVITHDLSQITAQDFVYVLSLGRVIEQGYRYDLERIQGGEFRSMMQTQRATGGFLPVKDLEPAMDWAEVVQRDMPPDEDEEAQGGIGLISAAALSRRSLHSVRAFSIVAGHTTPPPRLIRRVPHFEDLAGAFGQKESGTLHATAMEASRKRRVGAPRQHHREAQLRGELKPDPVPFFEDTPSFWQLVRGVYPTVPSKGFVFFGLVVSVASGAMTPVFSWLLSRLLFEVSTGAARVQVINIYGGIVLGVAAGDGLLIGLKYFVMETAAMKWVNFMRRLCFDLVLSQDKKWFDDARNSPAKMVQVLVKDGDDARVLMAEVLSQCVVVVAMLAAGLTWALVRGWQLTLVGVAIAPVFGLMMGVQNAWVSRCELRRKLAKEEVSKSYYEAILNIRGIRAMSFERAFESRFERAIDRALAAGGRGAFIEGCTYGVASALIYLAEALLFFVGALFLASGRYTYIQMVEVLNLIIFTVTIGSQLMAFTEKIAKSVQATRDLDLLLKLPTVSDESHGLLQPPLKGNITFDRVSFSYPARPDVRVLHRLSMKIAEGECVAIVGSSGSGKTTIAALLQRLYEPQSGRIYVGSSRRPISEVNAHYLRKHVAVVSQNPSLFDATITENIAYGRNKVTEEEVQAAARAANVHDFIMSLPQTYDTMVGDNAALISGGEAQRLQIARALARPCRILVLDESTSALDAANEAVVMQTIQDLRHDKTILFITHKLSVMRLCDRILVLQDGELKEQGTYRDLMDRNGVFAQLARSGEWVSG